MKALILNSGMGSRLGKVTRDKPKCMVVLKGNESILQRQLKQLKKNHIGNVVITTGYLSGRIEEYCKKEKDMNITLRYNERYDSTNYIYSIYLARDALRDDIVLIHGDMVFEPNVLQRMTTQKESCMAACSKTELSEKDFKGIVTNNRITRIGTDVFGHDAIALWPLYYLKEKDWLIWLEKICDYCEGGKTGQYAENALNEVMDKMILRPFDVHGSLCKEVDTYEDLIEVRSRL